MKRKRKDTVERIALVRVGIWGLKREIQGTAALQEARVEDVLGDRKGQDSIGTE
jgi:hypothetical protein